MRNLLYVKKEWEREFSYLGRKNYEIIAYSLRDFQLTLQDTLRSEADTIILISEYHPHLENILQNISFGEKGLTRFEPPLFAHPHCVFSGTFLIGLLSLHNTDIIPSVQSYATVIKSKDILKHEGFKNMLYHTTTPLSFSLAAFLLSLKLGIKPVIKTISPNNDNTVNYETLKTEFINTTAAMLSLIKLKKEQNNIIPNFEIRAETTLNIPGKNFLKKEFLSGFRKYAPFWKEHLYEDHFALLSAIYAGKEETGIEDRLWIRIMFDIIETSMYFENKFKIARRIFPIYALYLNSLHEKSLKEHISNYISVLNEEKERFISKTNA